MIERGGDDLRVLVVRLGALGDILRTLPPVRLVKRAMPRATIHWAVDDRCSVVLEGHPDIDGLVKLPRRDWQRLGRSAAGWPELLRSVGRFRARLKDFRAGLLLDFHGNLRSGVTGWLSGTPVRIGYEGTKATSRKRSTGISPPTGSRRGTGERPAWNVTWI